ncbi:MAG: hypothetical protein Q7T54_03435 [Candidatus Levybacteria bacterium]|nr:hypothetical protein [Candidatus Levybacteria bacterium]
MKIKILIPMIIGMVLLGGIVMYGSPNTKALSQNSFVPTLTLTPTPIVPSEKALKVAAFLVVRGTENRKKEYKKERGNENMSDSELIKIVALGYDSDPAKMAEKEALVQKIMAQEGQPVYYDTGYDESTLNNIKNNQDQLSREQESEMREQQGELEKLKRQQEELEYKQRNLDNCIQYGFGC